MKSLSSNRATVLVVAYVVQLAATGVAEFIIVSQEKKLKEWKKFSDQLIDALEVFEEFVPDEVVSREMEKMQFWDITRRLK